MAMVLTLVAVPLSRLRPRQGRYARVGFAIVVYLHLCEPFVGLQGLDREGAIAAQIGVWWVHFLALAFGLYLVYREGRGT